MAIEAVLRRIVKSVLFPRTPGLHTYKQRGKSVVIRYLTVSNLRGKTHMRQVIVAHQTKRYSPNAFGICSGVFANASITPKLGMRTAE